MYKKMNADEKLQFSKEVIEALQKGGFIACLELIDRYKEKLLIDNELEEVIVKPQIDSVEPKVKIQIDSKTASIYSRDHLEAVQEDMIEQGTIATGTVGVSKPKVKVLTNSDVPQVSSEIVQERPYVAPNPWAEAKTVSPGEVKNILTK